MKQGTVTVERIFSAPPAMVWQAITDREQMKEWYFALDKFEARPGFEFSFTGGSEQKTYLHLCQVTAAVPQEKLVYSWRYQDYPGQSFVSFLLSEAGGGTRLILNHTGLESFPADNPDFAQESFEAGWNHIIGQSLPAYLEKKERAGSN